MIDGDLEAREPIAVTVSELRNDIAGWLERVRLGDELAVTVRGAVVARVLPVVDVRAEARKRLEALRLLARVGDVESPIDEAWDVLDAHR